MYPNGTIIGENPSPIDIVQGSLGDCYFVSVLMSISTNKQELERIFITKTENSAGIYALKLLVNGEPKTIIIDDFIPVMAFANHVPAFM